MAKAKNKTTENDLDVMAFLKGVENPKRRSDGLRVLKMMQEISGEEPRMWGNSLVGFGKYSYKYASGREGEFFLTGFSPRKTSLTLYIMDGFEGYDAILKTLGKYKTGKSCLYIKKLEDIDESVLKTLIKQSIKHMRESHS